jgi:hypothetical protein
MITKLTMKEMSMLAGGEAISLAAVMAILVIAIAAVVAYRLFMSSEGSAQIPGGFKFTWE